MGELRSTFRKSDPVEEVCSVVVGTEENPLYDLCYKCALGAHGCCHHTWTENGHNAATTVHYVCGCGCRVNPQESRREKETW